MYVTVGKANAGWLDSLLCMTQLCWTTEVAISCGTHSFVANLASSFHDQKKVCHCIIYVWKESLYFILIG